MASPAERFGRYEVRATLGSGAMGTVYSAWDPELHRAVAIKIVKNQLDHDALLRFQREARTLAQLAHPNIVAIHDIGTRDSSPFIVMELVEGEALSSEIARHAERPLQQKLELAAQVCDALAFAHRAQVLHRDVKPANILITSESRAKLADFGLARLQTSSLTGSANVVGTPAYLPPEAFAGETIDERADVYGLAATLYEWLSGGRPHEAEHLAALMTRVVNADSPDIRDRWPQCPPGLAECLQRGLARDRSQRFASAADFAMALRGLGLTLSAPEEAASTVVMAVASPVRTRATRLLVASATLVIVAAAGVIGMWRPAKVAPPPTSSEASGSPTASNSSPTVEAAAPAPLPARNRNRPTAPGNESPSSTPLVVARAADTPPAPVRDEPEVEEAAAAALPIGSKLLVRILGELRTDRVQAGQSFEAELAEPLRFADREAIAASAKVKGVIDAVVAGSADRAPSLQLSLVSIEVAGQPVRVRTARYEIAPPPSDRSQRVLTIVIGAVTGAAIGGVTAGGAGAATGAAIGAGLLASPAVVGTAYLLGNVLTFKLAVPLRLHPGTL